MAKFGNVTPPGLMRSYESGEIAKHFAADRSVFAIPEFLHRTIMQAGFGEELQLHSFNRVVANLMVRLPLGDTTGTGHSERTAIRRFRTLMRQLIAEQRIDHVFCFS